MADQPLKPSFVVCVGNGGCDDLSAGMVYRVLLDEVATVEGLLRVVDDSGEDYLYPVDRFVVVEVSQADVEKLLAVAPASVG